MIAHGVSSAGMFFMVGVVYDRVHHRNLDEFGGLFGKMPVYTALAIGIFFAGLGLPGLCGFVGEILVVLSVFNYSPTLAIISAAVVIVTAGYILWAIQRVYLGAEYRGPHGDHLTPATLRENSIAGVLFGAAILFGVVPHHTVLKYMEKTIGQQVTELAGWAERHEWLRGVAGADTTAEATASTAPVAVPPPATTTGETREREAVPPALQSAVQARANSLLNSDSPVNDSLTQSDPRKQLLP
jgi:NADH-quinone oxidoreductase subunit M